MLIDLQECRQTAREAGLRYVSDELPGLRRQRVGKGFCYRDTAGQKVADNSELERIGSLAIPPAWTGVWICPDPLGHIQATGRDERGRKQYRYHDRWRAVRDANKFDRIAAFVDCLPSLREQVQADLGSRNLSREKVVALVIQLMERTLIRVGNRYYARENKSYGLTTLKDRHVQVEGSEILFRFRGKSGKEHVISLNDRRLARLVRQCQDLPGQSLFQYLDENGQRYAIESDDVNEYLQRVTGEGFTAKDFRTWGATVAATRELAELPPPASMTEGKRNVCRVIKDVAAILGNTPTLCRKAYVHPAVPQSYMDGVLGFSFEEALHAVESGLPAHLGIEEAAVGYILRNVTGTELTNNCS